MKAWTSIIAVAFCFITITTQAQVDLISMTNTNEMTYSHPVEVKAFYPIDEPAEVLNYQEVCKQMTYPQKAQNKGIEGTVHARFLIDETGEIIKYHILGPHESMEREVEKHISKIKFQAAHLNHYPVTSWGTLTFKFKLTNE